MFSSIGSESKKEQPSHGCLLATIQCTVDDVTLRNVPLCLSAQNKGDDKDEDTKDQNGTTEPEDTRPRALHKTCSIFLRNLAPSITKQEIEAVSLASIQSSSVSWQLQLMSW